MFTGLIEDVGVVSGIERGDGSARISVRSETITQDAVLGESVTVNGACLTVVKAAGSEISFDVVYETMQRTAFGALAIGDPVNLERSLSAQGRFGGHIVQGHVDGTGTIASIREVDNSYFIYITALSGIMRYVVRKGSIAVDGISLTVVEADDKTFSVSVIPYTWSNTNLSSKRAGDVVNIETDIIGKYVEKLLGNDQGRNDSMLISDLARDERPLLGASTAVRE